MSEPLNQQPKDRELIAEAIVSVSSEALPQQPIEDLALPEKGNNAMKTEGDAKSQEEKNLIQRIRNKELAYPDLIKVLSKTVYKDDDVKVILFLVNLLASTEEEQQNVILTGPSSVGKTLNIKESLWFVTDPQHPEKIIIISSASPRSFIHQANAVLVDERNLKPIDLTQAPQKGDSKEAFDEWYDLMRHSAYLLDFSNKIVVFLDTPDFKLLESLRSVLSHDEKVSKYWITDKNNKGMNKTKTVLIQGYLTALIASTNFSLDEQESSRNFLVSPNDDAEKIQEGIKMKARKITDPDYPKWHETELTRVALRDRVYEVQKSGITKFQFKEEDSKSLVDWFLKQTENLGPKANRDFTRLYGLAEAWALLNFKFRERTSDGTCIFVNANDIEVAKQIYEPILKCNELGLTPEEYAVWKMIEPECKEVMGLRIAEIHNVYYYAKKRHCSDKRLREMLKNFVCAGLLKEEKEGVIIKYYPITHKETKQSGLALSTQLTEKVNTNPFSSNGNILSE